MRKVLLDTNTFGKLFRGDDKVLSVISRAGKIYFSVFVLAELYAGFRGGRRESENRELLHRFMSKPTVELLYATEETAEIYAQLIHTLKSAGTPLPINDVWIASHVVETGSKLVTYDRHFLMIKGLRVWSELSC